MNSNLYRSLLLFTALFLFFTAGSQVLINEYSASNLDHTTDNYGKFEDWIEIYNSESSPVDVGGYGLSDKIDNPFKWTFPEGTTLNPETHLRVWASGRNDITSPDNLHTNFKLSQTKDTPEILVLTTPDGTLLDQVEVEKTQKDHARGRAIDGLESWAIFTNPTPGYANTNETPFDKYADKPEMSMAAGFYSGGVTVIITTTEPNSQIHYTTNGSEPTSSSQVFANPITLTSTTVLKARSISINMSILPGFIEFNTYFIDVNHSLGIMSTSAAELDDLLNGNQSLRPFGTFEYFNVEGVRTNIGYGEYNEHGQDSWVHDQRSIDYISRDECGYNYAIREKLIPFSDRDEFQRVILRAAGDDNYPGIDTSAHLRDYFVQNTADMGGLHLDVRKGQKGILYVNGEYWGVYGYREKVSDHDFTEFYYDQDKYNIYYLKLWGGSWAEYGGQAAWDDWNALHDFIKNEDLTNASNWEYVKSRYDYKSLVDYVHINSFVVCSDWINWNVGWWRGLNPEGGHQKWGYTLWDEDATFAHYINYTGIPGISPYTIPCFPEGLQSDPEEHILVLNKLRANPEFEQYYVSRYIDLYNTVFQPESMIGYLESIEDEMEPEMHMHVDRWGGTVDNWKANVNKIKNFVTNRHDYLPEGFASCWDLTGPYEISVGVEPEGAGELRFNSLELNEFPFTGDYFGGIDIKLEALETNSNYEFDYWELMNHTVTPNDSANNVTFQLTTADNLVAHFKERAYVDSLVINEINYNSSNILDTKDWVEFFNPHDYDLDIQDWIFRDSDDAHEFIFPENSIVEANGYLVLCRDTNAFFGYFPDVEDVYGNMDFGLSSSGELLRLYNDEGVLIDTVNYGVDDPWPYEPNGNGPTLELILPQYDNALAESWMASPNSGGTPGAMNSYWVGVLDDQMIFESMSLSIAPNPVHSSALIRITSNKMNNHGCLQVYNAFGKEVKRIENIRNREFILQTDNLPDGMYLLKFVDQDNKMQTTEKMIVR